MAIINPPVSFTLCTNFRPLPKHTARAKRERRRAEAQIVLAANQYWLIGCMLSVKITERSLPGNDYIFQSKLNFSL